MERRNNDIKKSFDLGQLHNSYLSNNNYFKKPVAFNNAGYGFKDEYFPQKYYNDDQIVNRGNIFIYYKIILRVHSI